MDANLAFLAAIVESSDDAIIGITPDGRIASWNSGANRIYGYTADEIVGQPVAVLSLPERRDEIPFLLQLRLRSSERVKHLQTLHLNKNGQMLQIYLSISPIIDNSGRPLGASVISRDTTERLHTQEALREAEEKYRLIFAAEADAILLFDATTGHLVDFNDAALKLYGYDRDGFSGLIFSDLSADFRPWERNGCHDPHGTISRAPMTLHRRSDGTIFTAEMSTSPFVWQKRSMFVSIVRDITERVRSQELLKSLTIAREIQQHLLPQHAPVVPGLDIYAHSVSCDDIGGDYYDFFTMPELLEPWFGFAVGDVSGHGIGAALLMGMAKGMLNSQAHNSQTDLAGIFTGMNRHLLAATDDSIFMTLFFGLFDPASRTLHWNSAGHGPVFWYRCRLGLVTELLPTAPPLSITSIETFCSPPPVTLEAGDILLLGTDGIWEACNPLGEMFAISRLRQLIATLAPKSARQIHDTIMTKVFDFISGTRPVDDMTLMVIKVVG